MDAERTAIAEICLHAAHDGSLSFPEIVGKLIAAGIEGYTAIALSNYLELVMRGRRADGRLARRSCSYLTMLRIRGRDRIRAQQ
ncbi:hypothetical protein U5903_20905 [Cereibacter johrii]|uniref:hypothetical protein n=1 Tax=Cereibacter johrii TaxID=445629 RepID=UPI002B25882D|nr:hypothetical protein [Cereibacter johrii]MEA5163252.1 hypothetical protein [Cereibacter johrii]